jgi:hypothetical protein
MRSHRIAVPVLLAVAVVTGFLAIFSTWIKRQALDTNNWTNTSGQLLQDPKIQQALGDYLVAQLFSNVDVASQLRSVLPQQLQGLAAPLSGGLRSVAEDRVPHFLARPRVQDTWEAANRAAHKQLIKVLDNKGKAVSTANGEVVLNTEPLIQQMANELGLGAQVPNLPPQVGHLVIMKSDQLATAQDITKAIRGLSIILTIVSLGLFAVAVWLAEGWRRVALRNVGWCILGLGLATLLIRRIANNQVVDGLVKVDSVKGAAHDAFLIGSSLLRSIGIAFVVYGLVIVFAGWLAGPTGWAVRARRWLAPTLRERPGVIYGAVGFVYFLVIVWGPTPAFRKLIPIVLIAILLVVGIEALRRQVAREFPPGAESGGDGKPPEGPGLPAEKDLAPSPS